MNKTFALVLAIPFFLGSWQLAFAVKCNKKLKDDATKQSCSKDWGGDAWCSGKSPCVGEGAKDGAEGPQHATACKDGGASSDHCVVGTNNCLHKFTCVPKTGGGCQSGTQQTYYLQETYASGGSCDPS